MAAKRFKKNHPTRSPASFKANSPEVIASSAFWGWWWGSMVEVPAIKQA